MATTMKAVGISAQSWGQGIASLTDLVLAAPQAGPRDLLVRVEAVSVNPLDVKMRAARPAADGSARVLGWDAAGTVLDRGAEVTLFKPGDRVFYAGSINRPGSNAQLHCVDERIVGIAPVSLDFAQAAALPLAVLAAWEALFERMHISAAGHDAGKTILIIGGAGGVGSLAIQLAKAVGKLNVVASASRPASQQWCASLGADTVVDHASELAPQLAEAAITGVDFILCLADTDHYFLAMAELVKAHGQICALVESAAPLPMNALRAKSATFSWEGTFTRSLFGTADMVQQHHILNQVAALVDAGRLRGTAQHVFDGIDAANVRAAHALIEAGHTIGKVVLVA
jgi:NADPH2:quinone reductase